MIALLTPSVVKLAHVFENHEHDICDTPQSSHIHELEWDCEFYKFKLNNQINVGLDNYDLKVNRSFFEIVGSTYLFLSEFHQAHISLRGPPQLA